MSSYANKYNLNENSNPIFWKYYLEQASQIWDADEVEQSTDKDDYKQLPRRYQELVIDLVAFFLPGDGLVLEQILNYMFDLWNESKKTGENINNKMAMFFAQGFIEISHQRGYKNTATNLFSLEDKEAVFKAVDNIPCVTEKAIFIEKYMSNKDLPLSLRAVAMAVSEGVFFVSLFAIIFYIRAKGHLRKFCFLNEQISKDEFLHRNFDIDLAKEGFLKGEFTREQALEIIQYGLDIEKKHVEYILRKPIDSEEIDSLGEITIENLQRYVSTLADQIVTLMGMPRYFTCGVNEEPQHSNQMKEIELSWMKDLSLTKKHNFYEVKVGNYKLADTSQKDESKKEEFNFDKLLAESDI